ncbi:hypothetical protein CRE_24260 [Caenorhabditis remanei]|uniref:Uncharacterized protein n=1 Tax=Caenorhabditis remanei TaxID=31234 RepID=E3NHQ9_CAERE|nr:hypothetical protein CRE_24260 [Caenorhabditis remanei]
MGAGVSGEPVYLTRSTMLISHTPMSHPPAGTQCTFRRQSTVITAPGSSGNGVSGSGISSQLAFPIQLYPNNVYNNHGYTAHVSGFEAHPTPPSSSHHHHHPNPPPPVPNRPSAPSEETPPPYSSIYPSLANRVN